MFPWTKLLIVESAGFSAALAYNWFHEDQDKIPLPAVFLIGAFLAFVLYVKFIHAETDRRAVERLTAIVGVHAVQIGITVAVVVLGWIVHWLKTLNQKLYGWIEIGFGTICVFSVAEGMSSGGTLFTSWLALGGLAYVVARGFSNIAEAKKITADNLIPAPASSR
jgi:hypothetical protein